MVTPCYRAVSVYLCRIQKPAKPFRRRRRRRRRYTNVMRICKRIKARKTPRHHVHNECDFGLGFWGLIRFRHFVVRFGCGTRIHSGSGAGNIWLRLFGWKGFNFRDTLVLFRMLRCCECVTAARCGVRLWLVILYGEIMLILAACCCRSHCYIRFVHWHVH